MGTGKERVRGEKRGKDGLERQVGKGAESKGGERKGMEWQVRIGWNGWECRGTDRQVRMGQKRNGKERRRGDWKGKAGKY